MCNTGASECHLRDVPALGYPDQADLCYEDVSTESGTVGTVHVHAAAKSFGQSALRRTKEGQSDIVLNQPPVSVAKHATYTVPLNVRWYVSTRTPSYMRTSLCWHVSFAQVAARVAPLVCGMSHAGRAQSVEAEMLTLNDVSLGLLWHLNTNFINFWKVNIPFKGRKSEEIFSLSFLTIYFVGVWVNLKVQTVFFVPILMAH